jgi:hypothetical protein
MSVNRGQFLFPPNIQVFCQRIVISVLITLVHSLCYSTTLRYTITCIVTALNRQDYTILSLLINSF